MKWILVILIVCSSGQSITAIRVSSEENCYKLAKNLPHFPMRQYITTCTEDKMEK